MRTGVNVSYGPTYKEQQQELTTKDLSTYGFLGYPVLMASDILLYKANHVPVGIDQVPHLELTREIARRFNHLYGEVFVVPEALLTEFPKVPGTDGRKMSKSYGNAVYLADSPEEITAKIRPMVTDPARVRRSDPGNPDVCPVFDLHKVFTPQVERDRIIDPGCRTAGIGCLDSKGVLLGHMLPALRPIYDRRKELATRPELVQEVFEEGAGSARKVAGETLAEAKAAMQI